MIRVGRVCRIGLFAELLIPLLGSREQRQINPEHHDLGAAALSCDPHVKPGITLLWGQCLCEERISVVGAWRRKNVDHSAIEQRPNLALRPPHGSRRGDNLRADFRAIYFHAGKLVERCLVESDHRSQRTGDQVQFVLDDQVRWRKSINRQRMSGKRLTRAVEAMSIMSLNPYRRILQPRLSRALRRTCPPWQSRSTGVDDRSAHRPRESAANCLG